jgi:hypothetical protein
MSSIAKVRSWVLRIGGHQTSRHSCGRTASGVRSQKAEIKYKKPNAFALVEAAGKGGRGVKISGAFREQLPHGSNAQIFFCGGEGLIIFSEIRQFKRSRVDRTRRGASVFKRLRQSLCTPWACRGKTLRIYFPTGGGLSKVAVLAPGPWGSIADIAAQFRRLFFVSTPHPTSEASRRKH